MSFELPPQEKRDERMSLLRRIVADTPGDEEAQLNLNRELERMGVIRKQVPVEYPVGTDNVRDESLSSERVWVEWKQVDNKEGQEIPCRIEKILRVKLRNAPLDDLVADGDYDLIDSNITSENFNIEESEGVKDLLIIHFAGPVISTEELKSWLEANELRGGTLKELLAIGSQFPEQKQEVSMIALEQPWHELPQSPAEFPGIFMRPGNAFIRTRDLKLYQVPSQLSLDYARFPALHKSF